MPEKELFKRLVIDETTYETRYTQKFASRKRYEVPNPGKLCAYIPGVILKIHARPGQRIKSGESLLVLEAMKMKNDIIAARDGVIREIHITVGQMVTKGQLLLDFE